ncbi:dTDP-4-dehydrorhamnose reductase [Vibrio rotiferianus]|uniref:dTDP-4-dehydrorhamnose reductase n=1 Tax=Vibrio rotiferianus TaxID=190895 RepID=UPI0003A06FDB|nr:dTDP-4-dehydrorhamnose reductase [Vibrio rotiferianus]PIB18034.1 dTDP-4-dehydrorhamnose reductase [Vibrio rotiferianus CAIM 577 = LMG 21460]
MRILLLGKNGQVGWELQRSLSCLGVVTAVDFDSTEYCGDFTNPEGLEQTILAVKPDVIVNSAAYTAVDKAEDDQSVAYQVNAGSVEVIAKAAEKLGAWLIHYSTDYVFDGSGEQARKEEAPTAPLNVYGASKLQGEQVVAQHCSRYLIFRTSWVYASRGHNFAKTMLKLAKERETLSIINDQVGAPTGAELLADCTANALRVALNKPEVAGLYHLVASGETTWYDYAQFVFDYARRSGIELAVKEVNAVPTSSFPTPAQRPHNSRLDTSKFEQTFELNIPHWKHGVERMLVELTES